MKLITIDMDALAKAIDSNTDASEQEARHIINTVGFAAPTAPTGAQAEPLTDQQAMSMILEHAIPGAEQAAPKAEQWTLTAPDGRQWSASSAIKCVAAEQRERIPADVALARIFAANEEATAEQAEHLAKGTQGAAEDLIATAISGIQYYLDVNPETRFLHGAIGSLRRAQYAIRDAARNAQEKQS